MKVIYKYPFKIVDFFDLNLPASAKILTCQSQKDEPYIWALVNTDEKLGRTRRFRVYGTGAEITEETRNLGYIGTIQRFGGADRPL